MANLYMLFSDSKNVDTYVFGDKRKFDKKYEMLNKEIYRKSTWSIDTFIWTFHCGLFKKESHIYKYAILFWKAYIENHWNTRHPFPDDVIQFANNLGIKNSKDASVFIIEEFEKIISHDVDELKELSNSYKWITVQEEYIFHEDKDHTEWIVRVWREKPIKTEFDTWVSSVPTKDYKIPNLFYLGDVDSEDEEPTLISDLLKQLEEELADKREELHKLREDK